MIYWLYFSHLIKHSFNLNRHNSVRSAVAIQSDILPFADHFLEQLNGQNYQFDNNSDWWTSLRQKCDANQKAVQAMANDVSIPLNYYAVFHHIQEIIPKDAIIVSEGANTMDIGRSMLLNLYPKHRLDAGTFGTSKFIYFFLSLSLFISFFLSFFLSVGVSLFISFCRFNR